MKNGVLMNIEKESEKISEKMGVKYCSDCKWSRKSLVDRIFFPFSDQFIRCANPIVSTSRAEKYRADALVSKRNYGALLFCSVAREYICGFDGKLWEKK